MKTNLHSNLNRIATRLHAAGCNTRRQAIVGALSLCLVAGIAAIMGGFSQTEEGAAGTSIGACVLTSSDGRMTHFRLIDRTADGIIAIRTADSKKFTIPIDSLCDADREFFKTWTPPAPFNELRPSSVSIAGNSTLTRTAYPSRVRPVYRSGCRSGGGVRVITGRRKVCTFIGSKTTVTPCR